MVGHYTPAKKSEASEIGRSADHLDQVVSLLILEEVYAMGDTTGDMMNRVWFAKSIV